MPVLGVILDPYRRHIRITFPDRHSAQSYHRLIQWSKAGAVQYGLDVYLRLPDSVLQIQASTIYDGFILQFADSTTAADWEDAIICKRVPNERRKIYIKRDWGYRELECALAPRYGPPPREILRPRLVPDINAKNPGRAWRLIID